MQSNKVYMGQMIRALRKNKGLDSKDIAAMIEPVKNANTVTSWERGETEPSSDYILQLCRIFDVSPQVFYMSELQRCGNLNGFDAANLNVIGDCFVKMNETQRRAVLNVARAMIE